MRRATRIDRPQLEDGAAMWRIANACGLDPNSPYKYLVFCRDFAASSAIAWIDGEPVAFVSGYRRPESTTTLFVWQVGVLDRCRGKGLASAMLDFLHASAQPPLTHLEATATPGNVASRRLFERFAGTRGVACEETTLFPAELFPEPHEPEVLFRIGPLAPPDGSTTGRHNDDSMTDPTRKGAPSA